MSKALVIVESPAKARTIKKYLGAGFTVKASVGHVKDLPKSKMGVDVERDFAPEYVIIRGKNKVLSEIKQAASTADKVYLAPDPDREGEAIAWHIADEIRDANSKVNRGLSAGRVQSVAVRIIVEREDEISAFKPEEYWSIECLAEGRTPPPFA